MKKPEKIFSLGGVAVTRLTMVMALAVGMTTAHDIVCPTGAYAQQSQRKVTGCVTDPTGEPLLGVTVMVAGKSSTGVITDLDGNYSIMVSGSERLQFSYIGFKTQTLLPGADGVLNVRLEEDGALLEEVVVVGFGQTKKESLTGSVAVVGAKQFEEKGSLSSPLEALQGQVPGVIVTRSSSAPGDEGWGMKLRGSVSMNSGGPLVIIDGVAGDMNAVNSNDIESINFLKDGAAAIYGSRAADGVVIITTKKGKEGKVKVNYGFSATLKTPGLQPETI